MPKQQKKKITTANKLIAGIGILAIVALLFGFQSVTSTTTLPSQTPSVTHAPTSMTSNPNATCHIHGNLPDPNCTPGSIDPKVTQANIHETICKSGYTKTVRPPVSYTNKLKKQQIAAYGFVDTNMHDYEEDHLISLELGGSPSDPKNLWPEPGGAPNPKDHIENLCHKKVCSGEITLAEAQHQIATNWQTACQ